MDETKLGQQIKLKDGRLLGYAEYGTAEGKHSHGWDIVKEELELLNQQSSGFKN